MASGRRPPPPLSGVLNLHKPTGLTSRQAVDRVCRLLGTRRVGHAGTLDSTASGVLVVCVGRATRCVEAIQALPKTYETVFRLGCRSASHDLGTALEHTAEAEAPPRSVLDRFLSQFRGVIPQRVPDYSAVRQAGRRLHVLARAGRPVPAKVRLVTIYDLEVLEYAFPRLGLRIRCGKGTYVRSIARDLGECLGLGAVVERLVRTAVGPFRLAEAIDLTQATAEDLRAGLRAPESAWNAGL